MPTYLKRIYLVINNLLLGFKVLSVALLPALHFRDQIYHKIAANQTSRIKNLDTIAEKVRLDVHGPVQRWQQRNG
jgi:hypothetical protein